MSCIATTRLSNTIRFNDEGAIGGPMYCSTCQAEACFGLNMPALLKALAISFTILLAAGISVQWQFFFGCSGHKGGPMWPGTSDSYLYKPIVATKPWKRLDFLIVHLNFSQLYLGFLGKSFSSWLFELSRDSVGHNCPNVQRDEFCGVFRGDPGRFTFVEVGTKESVFFIQVFFHDFHDFVASRDVTKDDEFQECSATIGCFWSVFPTGRGRARCMPACHKLDPSLLADPRCSPYRLCAGNTWPLEAWWTPSRL